MVASCCKKETLQENGQIIFDFKACCDCINIKKTTGLVCILLYAKKNILDILLYTMFFLWLIEFVFWNQLK